MAGAHGSRRGGPVLQHLPAARGQARPRTRCVRALLAGAIWPGRHAGAGKLGAALQRAWGRHVRQQAAAVAAAGRRRLASDDDSATHRLPWHCAGGRGRGGEQVRVNIWEQANCCALDRCRALPTLSMRLPSQKERAEKRRHCCGDHGLFVQVACTTNPPRCCHQGAARRMHAIERQGERSGVSRRRPPAAAPSTAWRRRGDGGGMAPCSDASETAWPAEN